MSDSMSREVKRRPYHGLGWCLNMIDIMPLFGKKQWFHNDGLFLSISCFC